MTRKIFGPRKRRTPEHVIEDQSVNHVERFIIDEGYTVQRMASDYGYDLAMFTYDKHGYVEPGSILIQLKARKSMQAVGSHFVFDVDIRDYNLWMLEDMPVILVLFDALLRRAYWLAFQDYFRYDETRRPRKGAKTVRVEVPKRQVVNHRAIAAWRELKLKARDWASGEES